MVGILVESASPSLLFAIVSLVLVAVYEADGLIASEFLSLASLTLVASALYSLNRRDGLSPYAVRNYKDLSFGGLDFGVCRSLSRESLELTYS